MFRVARLVRIVGIAIGSLVIAYLAVSLISGLLLGQAAQSNPLVGLAIVLLGGHVFADIMRRERPRSSADMTQVA
jgi:hypothetical protein